MRKINWKEALYALLFLLLAALLIGLVSRALRPVRRDYGAVWGPYLAEPEDSLDYLYLGSSYAYCDVDPARIYGESGLTGYVLAGPEQTLSQTYWYLRQALESQSPRQVVLEVSALHFARYQSYTQVNVGYLPAGLNRLGAVFTASEPELRTGLLFDLYFYHSRWKEVTAGELSAALGPGRTDFLKGYTAVDGVFEGIAGGPFPRPEQPEEVYAENLAWLGRIAALCEARGVSLALVLHPTYSQLPAETRTRMGADARALGLPLYDWSEETIPLGLVPALHYYDPGHLNRDGAAIFSAWLGDFFTGTLGLSPRPQSPENAAAWAQAGRQRERENEAALQRAEVPYETGVQDIPCGDSASASVRAARPAGGVLSAQGGSPLPDGSLAAFTLTQGKDGSVVLLTAEAESAATRLTVYDRRGRTIQRIGAAAETPVCTVDFIDADLDGWADLSLGFGGALNTPHTLYLWDPDARRFREVLFDGTLSYFEAYDGYLKNWCKDSHAGRTVQTLAWTGNRLVVAEEAFFLLPEAE